jgi:hypothetical protein
MSFNLHSDGVGINAFGSDLCIWENLSNRGHGSITLLSSTISVPTLDEVKIRNYNREEIVSDVSPEKNDGEGSTKIIIL